MKNSRQFCYTHSSGEDIYLFKLRNQSGTEVHISNYGAIITSFQVKQPDGMMNDIVLGFDKVDEYISPVYLENYVYFGSAIGRYANRIRDARFTIDGKEYRLAKNRGGNSLHGGIEGFDKKAWKVRHFDDHSNKLHLRYSSKDGEEGFPGNLEVDLHFQLTEENQLNFNYTATTDQATAINLTHHSYFNLNNGQGHIKNHILKINSDSILEQDGELCASGNLLPVADTAWDFRSFHSISEKRDPPGYDQSFVVDVKNNELTLMAEVYSEESNIKLQVFSSDPIVHFYTGQGIPELKGKSGTVYGPYSGFCLETHKHPNAVNIPHFPDTILQPLQTYRQFNSYRVFIF